MNDSNVFKKKLVKSIADIYRDAFTIYISIIEWWQKTSSQIKNIFIGAKTDSHDFTLI